MTRKGFLAALGLAPFIGLAKRLPEPEEKPYTHEQLMNCDFKWQCNRSSPFPLPIRFDTCDEKGFPNCYQPIDLKTNTFNKKWLNATYQIEFLDLVRRHYANTIHQ